MSGSTFNTHTHDNWKKQVWRSKNLSFRRCCNCTPEITFTNIHLRVYWLVHLSDHTCHMVTPQSTGGSTDPAQEIQELLHPRTCLEWHFHGSAACQWLAECPTSETRNVNGSGTPDWSDDTWKPSESIFSRSLNQRHQVISKVLHPEAQILSHVHFPGKNTMLLINLTQLFTSRLSQLGKML